jgi:hypothetical protein
MKHIWILPAFLASAFFLFSIWTMITTGQPFGFVAEHTHSTWGAQIGIDLFNALVVGIYFANVLSRQYRFRAWPYVLLTLCTASIRSSPDFPSRQPDRPASSRAAASSDSSPPPIPS